MVFFMVFYYRDALGKPEDLGQSEDKSKYHIFFF